MKRHPKKRPKRMIKEAVRLVKKKEKRAAPAKKVSARHVMQKKEVKEENEEPKKKASGKLVAHGMRQKEGILKTKNVAVM